MTRLSASLYAADPFRLAEQVEAVAPHIESFHLDIMDGVFIPDYGLNARLIGDLAARTHLPLDVHLMIRDPAPIAARYAGLGVRSIAVHLEGGTDFATIAHSLHDNGVRAYAALRHTTPISELERVEGLADGVLLLTAPAGGGTFQPDSFRRLAARPRDLPVIVDGRIEPLVFPAASGPRCRSGGGGRHAVLGRGSGRAGGGTGR